MAKLRVEDLKKIRDKHRDTFALREGGYRVKVTVHMGTCGIAAGARGIMNIVLEQIEKSGLSDVIATTSGCAGLCSREPMATVEILKESPVKYVDLTDEKIRRIFKEHIMEGNIVEEHALVVGSETTY